MCTVQSVRRGRGAGWRNFTDFALAKISVKDALVRGDGIWPVALEARSKIEPNAKILCFNNNGFPGTATHLFPGGGLITEPSRSSFGGKWHEIAFGNFQTAKAALESQSINFFLIDFNSVFFGCIPFSPLFDPDCLAERFEMVWASGSACLLTWRREKQGAPSLPPGVALALRQRVRHWESRPEGHPDLTFGRLYRNVRAIYDFNQGGTFPLRRPVDLERTKGWD